MADEQHSIGVRLDFDTKSMAKVPDEAKKMMARLEQVIADRPGGAFSGALSSMLGSSKGKDNAQAYRKAQVELRAHYAQQIMDTRKFYDDMQRLREKEIRDLREKTTLSYNEILKLQKLQAETPAMAARDRARASQAIRSIRAEQTMSLSDLARLREQGGGATPAEHTTGLKGFIGGLETGAGITRFGARAVGAIVGYKVAQAGRAALVRDQQRYALALRTGATADIYNTHGAFATRSSNLLTPDEDIAARMQYAGIAGAGPGMVRQAGQAANLGIGLGIGPEAGVGGVATLRRMGAITGDVKEQQRFATLLGEAIVQSQMRGREGEMLQSVIGMSEAVMRTSLNAPAFADTMSLITRLAMTGEPGAKGELGMRILGAANNAISGIEYIPGMRGVGQQMVAQTARGILAGTGVGPFEAQSILDQGATAKVPGTDKLLIDAILEKLNPQSEAMKLAVTGGFGMSASQGKAFLAMRDKRAGGLLTPEMEAEWKEHPERSGAFIAALEQAKGDQTAGLAAFKKIGTEAPAGEMKVQAMATAAEALDKAFRETLIPTVDAVAKAFDGLIERIGGAGVAGEALKLGGLGLLGYKGLSLLGKLPSVAKGIGTAATGIAALPGAGVAAAVGVGLLPGVALYESGGAKAIADAIYSPTGVAPGQIPIQPSELQGLDSKVLQMFSRMDPEMRDMIVTEAKKKGLPLKLVLSQIYAESRGNTKAESKKGALGLMQLMPSSFPGYSREQLLDPATNVRLGTQMDRDLLTKYGGDTEKMLAAYNWGPGNVQRQGMGRMPDETRQYVHQVEGMAHVIVDVNITDGDKRTSTTVAANAPMAPVSSPTAER